MKRFHGFVAAAFVGLGLLGAGSASAQSVDQLRAAMQAQPLAAQPAAVQLPSARGGAAFVRPQVFAPVSVSKPVRVDNQVRNVTDASNTNVFGPINTLALGAGSVAATSLNVNNVNDVK